jgi:hypothetical protein
MSELIQNKQISGVNHLRKIASDLEDGHGIDDRQVRFGGL